MKIRAFGGRRHRFGRLRFALRETSALGLLDGGEGGGAAPTGEGGGEGDAAPAGDPWYAGGVTNEESRTWLAGKGFTSLEDAVAGYRNLETAHGTGKFDVPADWTNPDQAKAAYKALGLPDTVGDAYKFELPEGADPALSASFAEAAHATGVLPHQAQSLFQWYTGLEGQAATAAADAARAASAADVATLRSAAGWGDKFAENDAIAGAAAKAFGFDQPKMRALASALGTKGSLEFLLDLGKKIGEDGIDGGGARGLGAMSGAGAAEAKTAFLADKTKTEALRNKEPAATAEWQRINDAMAAALDRAQAQ